MAFLTGIFRDTLSLYWTLVKIMVPVMIVVKVAVSLGLVSVLAVVFEPLMLMVGLPAEYGLVWATACLVNIYGGAAALLGVLPEVPLTVAQATVLGSMILAAHSLPIEQRVCQKAGASIVFTTALRFAAAIVYGALLNLFYSSFDLLQQPVQIAWLPSTPADAGWVEWGINSLISLGTIFFIILALITLLRLFDLLGVTRLLSKALAPLLRLMGIGSAATSLTLAGVLLGLSYGGALIIREAQAGHMNSRDIFLSVSFMAICHSLIEDTLFIMALGGHWSGILIGRVVFSILVMILLARIVHAMPDDMLHRWFVRPARA
ncbi:hypothetical protein [Telmatospirillum sp. J64-1]|uniref:hypothetical protein n=1 Tax=Telmatospirillum sp. J64-1 TaxID=2502183 RepID=UPI00115F19C0|nr:hypothetical protein [Telmatospirillum sp. J64-1]